MAANNSSNEVTPNSDPNYAKGIFYFAFAALVAFENVMVLVSFKLRQRSKRGIPDVLIVNLAISSLVTCVTVIGVVAYVRMTGTTESHKSSVLCSVQYFTATLLRLTDLATTTVMSVDRFLALWKPIFYRQKVTIIHGVLACVAVWIASSVLSMLPFVGFGGISVDMESLCVGDWTQPHALVIATNAYLQFTVVLICYVGIFRCINQFVKRQKAMTKSQTLSYGNSSVGGGRRLYSDSSVRTESSTIEKRRLESIPSISSEPEVYSPVSFTNPTFFGSAPDVSFDSNSHPQNALKESSKRFVSVENIKVKTKISFKSTEMDTLGKSTSKMDLRIKAALNRASWSEEGSTDNGLSDIAENNVGIKTNALQIPPIQRSASCPSNVNDVFEDLPSTVRRGSREVGIFRQWSVMVRDKWQERKNMRRSSKHLRRYWKESKYFAKIMGVVVLIFYVSWMPLAISINVVYVAKEQPWTHDLLWVSYNMTLLCSVAIPIAYALMCKPYREAYKRLFNKLRCKHGKAHISPRQNQSSIQER